MIKLEYGSWNIFPILIIFKVKKLVNEIEKLQICLTLWLQLLLLFFI